MSRAALHGTQDPFFPRQGVDPAMTHPVGGGGQRPSRLMQMRDDYQRRMLKEKEEKMVTMFEDNQRRNMQRVERLTHGGGQGGGGQGAYPNSRLRQPGSQIPGPNRNHPAPGQMGSTPSVRDFFRERRELEAKGSYVPPINHHYNQSRSRTGSGNSQYKNSAGVDRAKPLAPIQARHSGVSSAPTAQHNPFNNKARVIGKSRTTTTSPEADENDNYPSKPNSTRGKPSPARAAPPPATTTTRGVKRSPAPSQREEKLSDFQKWQVEQNRAREERLKKLNMRAPLSARESADFGGGGYEYEDEEEEGEDDEIARQQQELMDRIAKQQAELDRLRREREEEEELERQEAERLKKQEAADRERRRRQQQEEARQRREEEAEARREEEEQKRAAARAKQQQPQRQAEDDGYSAASTYRSGYSQKSQQQNTPRSTRAPHPPPQPQRRQPPPQRRAPPPPAQQDDDDDIPVPGPGSEVYAQPIEGEQGGRVRLVPCKVCGRKFADDRIQKHQAACKTSSKPRKVFDPTKMRTEGTEMAKYISKGAHKKEPQKKKKADWRRQHEEFINNIRYAKKMTDMEKQGMDLKDLPPPPPSHNPDLVPCPHCGRTFNDTAAERHIPRCQGLKTRPVAGNRRR